MKKTLLIISGWAHGIEAIRPMGNAFEPHFDVRLMTGAQVLREQSIPDADYIVTGSMGGLLSIELLPESCRKLVLISSTAKFCATEGYTCGTHEKILKRMILQLKRNPEAVLAAFYENVHFPHRGVKTDPEASLDELVDGLEYLLRSDVRGRVATLNLPVLILHGAEDRIIPAAAAEWLHDHLPNAAIKRYEQAGHALPAHHFRPVITAIQTFLSSK